MESLTEIIAWGLFAITFYIAINRTIRVDELSKGLNDMIASYKKLKGVIDEKDLSIEELRGLFHKALSNAREWEKLATCPVMPPMSVSLLDPNMQRVCSITKIPVIHPYGKVTEANFKNHHAFKKAQHDFLQELSKFVYSSARVENNEIQFIQEIFVCKPEKSLYEK